MTATAPTPDTPVQWVIGTIAFAAEIALVAYGGIVGYRLGASFGTAGRWVAAILAVIVLVAIWAQWMAPSADSRLPAIGRVALAAVLFGLVGLGLWLTGSPITALVFSAVGIAAMAVGQPLLDSHQ